MFPQVYAGVHDSMNVRDFQSLLLSRFANLFPDLLISVEWSAMGRGAGLYSPRLDLAIGPFATEAIYADEYDSLMYRSYDFINSLIDCHFYNIRQNNESETRIDFEQLRDKNRNARCFIAVEVENSVSRKHLMGGAINASALGRIGLAVAWTPEKLRAFVKMRRYLRFLADVGKNTFDITNLLIMDADQLLQIIDLHLGIQR